MILFESQDGHVIPKAVRQGGFQQEESYFYNVDRDLIMRQRAALDEARRATQRAEATKSHWMRCPKCGDMLEEVSALGVKSDQCPGCDGVFLDRAELEHLLTAVRPHRFRDALRKLVQRAITPGPTNWRHIPI